MRKTPLSIASVAIVAVAGSLAFAADVQPLVDDTIYDAPYRLESGWTPLLNGRDLSGWHSVLGWHGEPGRLNEWFTTKRVNWSQQGSPTTLSAARESGGIIMNGVPVHTTNLVSYRKFGDTELYVEFLIAKGSNSGVYLHGLYEVQIFDSYAVSTPLKSSDGGGIYQRWIDNRGAGGTAPSRNMCRPPGEWQSYHIWFRAPRFDSQGKKTENAKFLRVVYNGLVIHTDVECDGPTRSAIEIPEAPQNPIMLQGDHGPVAFRNLYVRALRE
jgi:hypothetical protein